MDLATLPKLELHLHFAGAIDAAMAARLAARRGIDAAALGLVDGRYPRRYRDLAEFLELYGWIEALVRRTDDVADVAAELARAQAAQGVAWTEVITPIWAYLERGLPADGLWGALAEGFRTAGPGVSFGVLLETFPGAEPSPAQLVDALDRAAAAGVPVVGIGLMGVGTPAGRPALAEAAAGWRAGGLGLQVHAGEVGPPGNVEVALDDLGAARIAHGITVVRDPRIRDRMVRDRVPLDLCPSSNVAIAGVPSLAAHPLRDLWAAGATVTISTDDPPFVDTTLLEELRRVAELLELDERDLAALQLRTLAASFAPPDVRADVAARIEAWAVRLGGPDGPVS